MTQRELLHEIRRAVLDGCPVTVETIVAALDRLVDPTALSDRSGTAVALIRGHLVPKVRVL